MLEVCADCIESAINGCEGGAMRLELCSALSEGGLTPSVGLLTVVKKTVSVPVFCMVRPRSGEDFSYSAMEIEAMKVDIQAFKERGVDGLVFGCLTPDKKIDVKTCEELLECAGTLPVTFHRAFDYLQNPYEGLETLIKLGFKRVLTSGQAFSVEEGKEVLKGLIQQARGRIIVMPGGGINEFNLKSILEETNAIEFHGSAKKIVAPMTQNKILEPVSSFNSIRSSLTTYIITDVENVKRLIKIAHSLRET